MKANTKKDVYAPWITKRLKRMAARIFTHGDVSNEEWDTAYTESYLRWTWGKYILKYGKKKL